MSRSWIRYAPRNPTAPAFVHWRNSSHRATNASALPSVTVQLPDAQSLAGVVPAC